MNRMTRFAMGVRGTVGLLALVPLSAFAATPSLGAAATLVVLGGAGVTCTASSITGNVGSKLTVLPTPTCHIAGAIVQGAAANLAFSNFDTAYNNFKGLTCPAANNLTTKSELGGQTLASGVYCFDSTAALTTGILTLTGSGPWIFQIGSGITTAGPGQVVMAGGSACNVYWVPTSAATIGTGTKFLGNILAGSAVTFTGTGSSLMGRALAHTAVTATGATITGCGRNAGKGGGEENENEDHDKDDGHHDGNGDHDGDHHGND
jgi:Ice-binding-like